MARISEIVNILNVLVREDVPQVKVPFIKGFPGVGKSMLTAKLAERFGNLIDFRISYHDATDFKIPNVNKDAGTYNFISPDLLPLEGSHKWDKNFNGGTETKGILFFDEINRPSNIGVLQTLFQVVLDRKIGEHKLLPGWRIVAAGNLGYEDGTEVVEFDSALLNRFMIMNIDNHNLALDWIPWAKAEGVHPLVTSFIETYPSNIYIGANKGGGKNGSEKSDKNAENMFVTPRDWVQMSALLKQNPEMEPEKVVELFGPYLLHHGFTKFYDFAISSKSLKAKDILFDLDKVESKVKKLDRDRIYGINSDIVDFISNSEALFADEKVVALMVKNFHDYCVSYLAVDNYFALIQNISKINMDNDKIHAERFVDTYFTTFKEEEEKIRKIAIQTIQSSVTD